MSAIDDKHSSTAKSAWLDRLEMDEVMRERKTPAFIVNPGGATKSASVAVGEEREGVIYARFQRKIYLNKPRMESGVHDDWQRGLLESREVPPDQQCCIN